jgi:PP-loop superfamily ATP-utilizing enzyme
MVRARVWFRCAAMHDPVSPVLLEPCNIGWEARERQVDLTLQRPLKGAELVSRMKGWVTVDVEEANRIMAAHGRLKLLDERELVVECEDRSAMEELQAGLAQAFGDQMDLEITKG